MYQNAIKARDAGVSLAFFGGNSVLCVVPMEPSSSGVPNRCIRRGLVFAYARKHVGGG